MALASDSPRSLAARQLRAAVVLLLLVGAIVAAAWVVYRVTVGRAILAGQRAHDFGRVELAEGPVALKHTFTLTNRSGRVVRIAEIRTTCGCTVADPSTRRVEPGETVDVSTTLTLDREGRKRSQIFIIYEGPEGSAGAIADDGADRDTLQVSAEGRKKDHLVLPDGVPQERARLAAGEAIERGLTWLDYDSSQPPPSPQVTAPPGLTVTVGPWARITQRRGRKGLPARWWAVVRLQLQDTADPPPDAAVVIAVGGRQVSWRPGGKGEGG